MILSATSRTSRSLWVMKTMALPASLSWRMMPISSSVSCGRQHRGGLVEDQHLGVAGERLDDLDALLHADGEVLDDGVGLTWKPKRWRSLDALAGGVEVEPAKPVASSPSMTFSATVKTG